VVRNVLSGMTWGWKIIIEGVYEWTPARGPE
jgi:hypothetical protein